ncbi:nudC domain-containing protein 3 [Alligator mississippiensis]|uniref:NudC domain-containing protein 3 n=1 Tax=Alligator mississippiensis TaxID=8496 RepID=A0A151MM65_ALLMI|nr:nudC domain-containing protein 3 [Alligator mississippiensis]KYO25637.1 nudC domain-containing protein 3 [Alligator mississippiensis]
MEPGAALTDAYDQALLGILQHAGGVRQFLHVLFGFLYRRTDFYRLLRRPTDRLGFPPGAARAMVGQAFKAFEHMAQQDDERRQREMEEKMKEEEEAAAERTKVPPAAQEVEIESTAEQALSPKQGPCIPEETAETATSTAASELPGAMVPTEPQPPQLPMRQEQFQTDPDSYNGAVRENYAWSQDYSDLEIKVPVPKHIVKGKQVAVEIGSSWLRVALQEGNGQRILVEGKLTHKINTENSLWSLEPGKCVLINLSKGDEYWWNAILEGEEPIDIDKINKERSMATVDEEEHAVLDRLTFDYHQKLQGKPQSHELKVHEMLKKGWDAEGSPFRGQKFDPSMFNISPGAVQF